MEQTLLQLSALAAILPVLVLGLKGRLTPRSIFIPATGAALAGSAVWVVYAGIAIWPLSFSWALWVSVAAAWVVYLFAGLWDERARPLGGVLAILLLIMASLGLLWGLAPAPEASGASAPGLWFWVHVGLSLLTYAALTLAAVASIAAWLQERVLKSRGEAGPMVQALPALRDCETLVFRFLWEAEIILGMGLLSGIALNVAQGAGVVTFDHKTILTIAAFVVVGTLLFAHSRYGTRGRRAGRIVLLAYLLITLAFPGVKFVTDVLL